MLIDAAKKRSDDRIARLADGILILAGVFIAYSVFATQYIAHGFNYHPGLGHPWFRHIYNPFSWMGWWHQPWAVGTMPLQHAQVVGYLTCSVASILFFTGGLLRNRTPRRHEGVHGTSKWAAEKDLVAGGVLGAPTGGWWQRWRKHENEPIEGVFVGGWKDKHSNLHYLRHNGPEHVLGIGPLRSGKSLGLVVPTLVTWRHSVITYDEKGELWEMTSGWRSTEADNICLRFEPASPQNAVRWNPFAECKFGTALEFRDVGNVVEAIGDPQERGVEGHFDQTAVSFLVGLVLHVAYTLRPTGKIVTPGDVLRALNEPGKTSETLLNEMVRNTHLKGRQHPEIAVNAQSLLNKDPRERSGVGSTADRMLKVFKDPIVAANTSSSDFTIHDLMNADKPISLYIVTRGMDKKRLQPLVRLLLGLTMTRLCSADMTVVDGEQKAPHKRRLLFLVDEFASLGGMPEIPEALSKCAGYGIKAYLLVQDREQIVHAYGDNENITSHTHIKAVYAPNNQHTAEWLESAIGDMTVVVENVTESGQRLGNINAFSRSMQTIKRPLITASEIRELRTATKNEHGRIVEPGHMLILIAGRSPIYGMQTLYFLDPEMMRRVSIEAPVQSIVLRAKKAPAKSLVT